MTSSKHLKDLVAQICPCPVQEPRPPLAEAAPLPCGQHGACAGEAPIVLNADCCVRVRSHIIEVVPAATTKALLIIAPVSSSSELDCTSWHVYKTVFRTRAMHELSGTEIFIYWNTFRHPAMMAPEHEAAYSRVLLM
jgi:hypothetical protein